MTYAWVASNSVPFEFLNFTTNEPVVSTSNIAEAGTLALEWSTLNKYTKNHTYCRLAESSLRQIGSQSWGGGSDSYFEYLLKYARLSNTDDPVFMDTWKNAIDSSVHHLLRKSTVGVHLYTCTYDATIDRFLHISSHLACLRGGNWLYGQVESF